MNFTDKLYYSFAGLALLIAFLLLAQFFLSNHLAALGGKLKKLETEITITQDINEGLSEKVASASALTTISNSARELGFSEPMKNQYLTLEVAQFPVAIGVW